MWNRLRRRSQQSSLGSERGQALVLIALAFIGLAAFVGLTVDAGILFSYIGHLRRATDAASLAAANQFREGRAPEELSNMAFEMLELNGLNPVGVVAKVCDVRAPAPDILPPPSGDGFPDAGPGSLNNDDSLCPGETNPPSGPDTLRKYVRVETEVQVNFAFLPIIGWDSTVIRANSISEAASVDLVLVLDISASMSYNLCGDGIDNDEDGAIDDCSSNNPPDATGPVNGPPGLTNSESGIAWCIENRSLADDQPGDDPGGPPDGDREDDCHPFEEVRAAAHLLVDRMYYPYDRLGIVTFARLAGVKLELDPNDPPQPCGPVDTSDPDDLKACADNVIDLLDPVLEANVPVDCPNLYPAPPGTGDPRGCGGTNTGDGMKGAAGMYCRDAVAYGGNGDNDCDPGEMREEAVWIAIVLSDGVANSASKVSPPAVPDDWWCPEATWAPPTGSGPPYCNDGNPDPSTRHASTAVDDYDADDYARDWADFLGCPNPPNTTCAPTVPLGGQDVVIFSIGLGKDVTNYSEGGAPDQGEQLLRYIADVGDDGDAASIPDPCAGAAAEEDCGNYYFVLDPSGGQLLDVFEAIASRIFTRITH